MSREYCPKCQSLQNMYVTKTESINKDNDGKIYTKYIESYQCSACNIFVKSEIKSDLYSLCSDCENVNIIINEKE